MKKDSKLLKILEYLEANEAQETRDYYVPSLWMGQEQGASHPVKTNPFTFFKNAIKEITAPTDAAVNYNRSLSTLRSQIHGYGGDWTYQSAFYNLFPRLTTAYDHDNDGHVGSSHRMDITSSDNGFRETGTLLKCIAILKYIRDLGCDTVYMLPITSIGEDGNRGDLGSPYAIKDQYKLDENLADPLIPFSVEEQFEAFVEAAHMMGMRVIMEFVLRTSSLGGDWVKTNPEWFYWIDRHRAHEYQSPEFPANELADILKIPKGGGFHFAPNNEYRSLFKKPPTPEQIQVQDGKYVAYTDEGELIIPGAFADWPPDDIQPAWSDVTYLRMYNFPYDHAPNDYNYIAYDTIRYYNPELAQPAHVNRPLWDKIAGVIPHYQSFGIDGVMIDMGHALPKPLMEEIIHVARQNDPDFAFCEENFDVTQESREAGFNAVLGHEWRVTSREKRAGIQRIVQDSSERLALPYYGTPETHNTPRAMMRGGEPHCRVTYVLNKFLPNSIPFIHQGFELLEEWPVNTGLNFLQSETDYYSQQRLPLFFKSALRWNNDHNLIGYIKYINSIYDHFGWLLNNVHLRGNEKSMKIHYPETSYESVIGFERFDPWHPEHSILVIANTDYQNSQDFYINVPGTNNGKYWDFLEKKDYQFVENWLSATLQPGQCLVIELKKLL
ncbi:alpha-amylase family glycosyl hydrolase [Flammeovirga sp. EKP202]|uniref:alpha-amylase family glycosyl hydrolase n=1 Tax=Flammeovirga sp. EKP202 TaxID=2770592 RepID=UPI00165FD354|nr:alpha-amylase family glycosyl hydrolase [Flammeovirga sp. EKP202]MBD0403559.1 alpha-amylase [Flammeovirga sp. EKP202]